MYPFIWRKKKDNLDLEKSLRIDRMKELIKRQVKEMQMKENLLDELYFKVLSINENYINAWSPYKTDSLVRNGQNEC